MNSHLLVFEGKKRKGVGERESDVCERVCRTQKGVNGGTGPGRREKTTAIPF